MRAEMEAAYKLIANFRRGAIASGSEISKEQERLIRLVAVDLDVPSKGVPLEQLVLSVAKSDSSWNKRTVDAIDRFYMLRERGDIEKAERERNDFLQACPSVWYCGMLTAL